jgi:hypothetical protein
MAKYVHLSRVYLSDSELYELLAPKNIASRKLRQRMRGRGLFYSDKGKEADVRSRISFLPSDWNLVSSMLLEIAGPDPRERKTAQRVTNYVPSQNLSEAVGKVQDERAAKYGEVYNTVVTPDGITKVEVTYTELDYSRAVPYQRRERKLSIDIAASEENLNLRYNASERAAQIVEGIKSCLEYKEKDAPEVKQISLNGVRDPVARTKFFTQLIKGITGFKYENTTHISVDRRFPTEEDDGDDSAKSVSEDKTDPVTVATNERRKAKIEEQMKGLINKVAFTGEQILATELYSKAAESGYYIAAIHWTCISQSDPRVHIDCEAALVDPAEGEPFSFDLIREWQNKPEDPDEGETSSITMEQRRNYESLIETAAYNAIQEITLPTTDTNGDKTQTTEPAK